MPFDDCSFDIVASRLAFHHFENADVVFKEMRRVLKPNGKIVIVDMLARKEPYRKTADEYECLRDVSHVKCLTDGEFISLAARNGLSVLHNDAVAIPMCLNAWLNLTKPNESIKNEIITAMLHDINGGAKTGFSPYKENGEIKFNHVWSLYVLG